MKRIYSIIILSLPIYLHAQTVAPRRPLTIDSLSSQSTRKSLLQLRQKIKDMKKEMHKPHETPHVTQKES